MERGRRQFLAAFAGATAAALGGCATPSGGASDDVTTPTGNPAQRAPTDESVPGQHGYPPDICQHPIMDDPGIYAVTDPAFGRDWADLDIAEYYVPPTGSTATPSTAASAGGRRLLADQTIIGIAGGDLARAYPVSVLWHHEIVNDDVGAAAGADAAGPVIVTYCPLCLSGLVASRVLDGAATTFAVTGQLWRPPRLDVRMAEADNRSFGARNAGGETVTVRAAGNLVMYDEATRSYWSQATGEAICGPKVGTTLDVVPSAVTSWADWQRDHPDTEVLLPPPYSGTTKTNTGDG